MSTSISIHAFTGKENPEFKKHLGAVEYCIKHGLSFPKETSEFFKGQVGGDDLEDVKPEAIMKYIERGIEIPISREVITHYNDRSMSIEIKKLPATVDEILVKFS